MRFLLLLIATSVSASLQAEQQRNVRGNLGTKLKEEFHFEPSLGTKAMDTPEIEVLVLEKITVTRSAIKWDLFEQVMIQKHQERLKEETFTLGAGGPLASRDFGKVRAQIGLWGEGGGYTFLKLRW
jgi:hypothetical protein